MQVKENILEAARKRGDTWGEAVSMRITNVADLVAAEGRYHGSCIRKFFHSLKTYEVSGRPETEYAKTVIDFISSFLEEHRDKCQFSLTEILKGYEGVIPTNNTLRKKLQEKYGDDIIFTIKQNREFILSFRDTGHKILTSNWYEKQNSDIKEERLKIVKAAAEIITEDIRSQVYETNNYPPSDAFLKNVESDIRSTLQLLLNLIIMKNKRGSQEKWNTKVISIAHAIITAFRPKSFFSNNDEEIEEAEEEQDNVEEKEDDVEGDICQPSTSKRTRFE
ncbi:hypothetical protein RF55_19127 [Lasius niger]|uniref:Uncharacterized protein n=1 Tax=Lasius niger TaxID=67767 RepID=A0A0J7K000_LASNI|nr:hypothetical protein RF55_19127 [Lasius niger]